MTTPPASVSSSAPEPKPRRTRKTRNQGIFAGVLTILIFLAVVGFMAFPSTRNDPTVYRFASILLALFAGAAGWIGGGTLTLTATTPLARLFGGGGDKDVGPGSGSLRATGAFGLIVLVGGAMFFFVQRPISGTIYYERGDKQQEYADKAVVKLEGTNIEVAYANPSGYFSFPDQAGATDIRVDYQDIKGAHFPIKNEKPFTYTVKQKRGIPPTKADFQVIPVAGRDGHFRLKFEAKRSEEANDAPGIEVTATRNISIDIGSIAWVAANSHPAVDNKNGPWVWLKKVDSGESITVQIEVSVTGVTAQELKDALDIRYRYTWEPI